MYGNKSQWVYTRFAHLYIPNQQGQWLSKSSLWASGHTAFKFIMSIRSHSIQVHCEHQVTQHSSSLWASVHTAFKFIVSIRSHSIQVHCEHQVTQHSSSLWASGHTAFKFIMSIRSHSIQVHCEHQVTQHSSSFSKNKNAASYKSPKWQLVH